MGAGDDVKIKVVLDTKDAQAALNALGIGASPGGGTPPGSTAPAGGTTPGGGFGLGKILGYGAGLVGAGAILSPLAGPTLGGIGDILGEKLGGLGARIETGLFGNLPAEARASAMARKNIEDVFAYHVAQTGTIPPMARASYEAQFARNTLREKGIQAIEKDKAFRQGDIVDQVDKFTHSVLDAIAQGFNHLGDKIVSVFKNHR